MKRKAVAAVLTAVMVASMFTGCGSDNGSSSAKSASAASAASAANDTVDEDGKVNGIMYQEGLPLVDEGDYTFSIFCDDSSESGEFTRPRDTLMLTTVPSGTSLPLLML